MTGELMLGGGNYISDNLSRLLQVDEGAEGLRFGGISGTEADRNGNAMSEAVYNSRVG